MPFHCRHGLINGGPDLHLRSALEARGYPATTMPIHFAHPVPAPSDVRKQWRMPPSFKMMCLNVAMFVRMMYTLTLTVTKARLWSHLSLWKTNKTYAFPLHKAFELIGASCSYITLLDYHPRMRPVRQILMRGTVLASVKSGPKEWTQLIGALDVRPRFQQEMTPIECQVRFSLAFLCEDVNSWISDGR